MVIGAGEADAGAGLGEATAADRAAKMAARSIPRGRRRPLGEGCRRLGSPPLVPTPWNVATLDCTPHPPRFVALYHQFRPRQYYGVEVNQVGHSIGRRADITYAESASRRSSSTTTREAKISIPHSSVNPASATERVATATTDTKLISTTFHPSVAYSRRSPPARAALARRSRPRPNCEPRAHAPHQCPRVAGFGDFEDQELEASSLSP
jgi:hypothetical protein